MIGLGSHKTRTMGFFSECLCVCVGGGGGFQYNIHMLISFKYISFAMALVAHLSRPWSNG